MAVKGDKKVVTTTDEQGLFQFPELADGDWIIDAEMVGFVKVSKRINVGSQAATAE